MLLSWAVFVSFE